MDSNRLPKNTVKSQKPAVATTDFVGLYFADSYWKILTIVQTRPIEIAMCPRLPDFPADDIAHGCCPSPITS